MIGQGRGTDGHIDEKNANALEGIVCANGGGRHLTNPRCSIVTLNGAFGSTTATAGSSNSSTLYGACNRLVFLGNIYSRTDQLDRVTEC